jgi:hypothetical protein
MLNTGTVEWRIRVVSGRLSGANFRSESRFVAFIQLHYCPGADVCSSINPAGITYFVSLSQGRLVPLARSE